MLPAHHRMRAPGDFRATIRGGTRGKSTSLMVHLQSPDGTEEADQDPTLVGFVVPKTVGNAVIRNRLTRQLKHLMAARIRSIPPGQRIVIRVFPAARGKTSDELGVELDRAVARALTAKR